MKKRTLVSPTDLYQLLDREFKRRQPRDCGSCYVQFPYRVDRSDANEPNWEVLLPPQCELACRSHAQEIISELAERYDIEASE